MPARLTLLALLLLGSLRVLAVEPFQVGVLYWSMNIAGQVAMREGVEAQAARINAAAKVNGERGVELIPQVAGDGEAGIERQIRQMEALVARGVDLIVVQPTDNAALARPLQAANRAGIPVVAYDQYISGGELASYVTSDNYQAGWLGGEYVAARHPKKEALRVALVEYPHVSSTVERVDGFIDALNAAGRPFEVVGSYRAVEPVAGRRAGQAILRDFPERGSLDVLFAVNDGGGLSVVEALAAAGRDEIFVATIDGDPKQLANIRERRLARIDAAQFCGPLGEVAMSYGYRLLLDDPAGEPVPRHALVPVFPVTAETLSRYPGWSGPIPAPFEKPWASDQRHWSGAIKVLQ